MRIRLFSLLAFLLAMLAPACNNSSDPGPGYGSIVLTDAASDEIDLFEADVTDVTLHRLSGNDVSVLTRTARIDFTSLETVGELIATAALPLGTYTGLTMTLDFSTASVFIKDKTIAATIKDRAGATLNGLTSVVVNFSSAALPAILAGRSHMFMLDLDLNQALSVDATNNVVTFDPILSAQFDPLLPKPLAATGILKSVDVGTNSFVLEKRTLLGQPIGDIQVKAGLLTIYQVNGVVMIGPSGLAAVAGLTLGTSRVFVQGVLDANQGRLNAIAVEAGAGTFGNGQDWVAGVITGRTGGAGADASLTIMGRSLDVSNGTRLFNTAHTVNVSFAQTKVLKRGSGNSLTADALNVGQAVLAFGTISGSTLTSTGADGVVRMLKTSIWGTANSAPSGTTLTLNVSRINLRAIGSFNFTVNGQTEATPTAMTVDVSGLNTTGITTGSKIRALGWFNAVGVSTDDNFDAASLVNHTTEAKLMFVDWSPSSATALTPSSSEITMDLTNTNRKLVFDGFSSTTLTSSPTPTIQPRALLGIYRIVENGSVALYLGFPGFATALSTRITVNSPVQRLAALGTFDDATQLFRANIVTVVLE